MTVDQDKMLNQKKNRGVLDPFLIFELPFYQLHSLENLQKI